MPAIPTYERQTAEPDTQPRVHVPVADTQSPVAQGLAALGQGIGTLTADLQRQDALQKQAMEKQTEERAKVWAGQQAGQSALDEMTALEQAKNNAPSGADGFAKGYLADIQKRQAAALAGAPDEASKRYLAAHQQAQLVHFGTEAQNFQFKEADRDVVNRHIGQVATWATVVSQDPRQYDVAMKSALDTMPDVVPDVRERLFNNAKKTLGDAAATHLLGADPKLLYDLTGKALNIQPAPAAAQGPAAAADAPGSYTPSPTDARGVRNNNPGNIRLPAAGARGGSWQGEVAGADTAFVTFDSPQSGIRAMTKNLLGYQDQHGLNTVQGIVGRWAPSSENDTGSYVKTIAAALGVKADQQIDLHDPATMQSLVGAMIAHENGKNPYGADIVKQGVGAAMGLSQLNPQQPPPIAAAPPEVSALEDGVPKKTGVGWADSASPEQLAAWRQHAFTEMQRTQAIDRTALASKVKDFQSMILTGVVPPTTSVPTQDEYIRAYGPTSAHQYQSEVADYNATGDALRKLGTASAADRVAIINAATPTPGPDFDNRQRLQGALMQANALIEKQIVTDPAAYAARNSPGVSSAWSTLQRVQQDKAATDVDKRAAVVAYAQATIGEQQRLGVDSIKGNVLGEEGKARVPGPRLLTNGQANDIAGAFAKKPADAAQIMSSLEQQWGSYFPQVYGQLARDDKLPPAALVIPNMSDPYAKEQLARIADPKVQKELKEALPLGAEKDIDAKLQSLNEPFLNSLMFQQGGIDTHAVVMSQQKALAASYVAQGKSVGDASKLAFQQTVGWQYHFDDSMRIPNKEVPDVVKAGTGAVTQQAAMLDVAVPPSFRAGLKAEDRKAAWTDAIRTGATWVTNGDETGLTLHVAAKTDAGQDALFAVRQSDGTSPMSWSWSQLRDLGAAAMKARIESLSPANTARRAQTLQAQADEDAQRRRRDMGLR